MMKFILWVVFMIPLCFNYYLYTLLSYLMLLMLFLLKFNYLFMFSNISYFMGCDVLSYFMVILSVWICFLMLISMEKFNCVGGFFSLFMMVLLFMCFSLLITFISMNLFFFYLFFEISLIPTLLIILGWGFQPERIQAGMYMFMYMLLVSLPMLITIFYLNFIFNTLDFFFFNNVDSYLIYVSLNFMFLVKMPMYLVHLWLPKAHLEAPVAGSMILAGVMLKLGGYGLIRLMMIFYCMGMLMNFIIIIISLIGGLYISLICMRQSDIKSLIAYSSISHMSLVLSGIMTLNLFGVYGSFMMMISHGLCSSGLFCLINLVYERVGSRSFYLNKGMINVMPILSLWWFLFCSFNMSAPPSFNLLGEIFLINSLVSWGYLSFIILVFLSFFSAVYSLYLYSFSQHGKFYSGLFSFNLVNIREYLLMFFHLVPLVLLSISCDFIF